MISAFTATTTGWPAWAISAVFVSLLLLALAVTFAVLGLIQNRRHRPDPKRRYFHRETVRLADLLPVSGPPVIEGRTFEDCTIVGPAVVAPMGIATLQGVTFDGHPSALFIEVPMDRVLIGVIALVDCTFRGGKFQSVGIIGNKELGEKLRANVRGKYQP